MSKSIRTLGAIVSVGWAWKGQKVREQVEVGRKECCGRGQRDRLSYNAFGDGRQLPEARQFITCSKQSSRRVALRVASLSRLA